MLTVGACAPWPAVCSFVVTLVDNPSSLQPRPPRRAPGLTGLSRGSKCGVLPLAELEAAAGALLPVLLALLDAGVPGEEARLLEPLAQLEVEHAQRAGDAVPQRAGLGHRAAPVEVRDHVELLQGLGHRERLLGHHLQGLVAPEVFVDGAVVQLHLAVAGPQPDTGDRGLPLARGVVLEGVRGRAQRARSCLFSFSTCGFCAWCGWA